MPRFRAIRPVRIELGVHFGTSGLEASVLGLGAAAEIVEWIYLAQTWRWYGRWTQSLSILTCDGKRSIQKGKVPFSMQTWPSYYCPPDPSAKARTKSKKFDKSFSTIVDYGVIGAATLIQNGGRLEWGSLVSSQPSGEFTSYSHQWSLTFWSSQISSDQYIECVSRHQVSPTV